MSYLDRTPVEARSDRISFVEGETGFQRKPDCGWAVSPSGGFHEWFSHVHEKLPSPRELAKRYSIAIKSKGGIRWGEKVAIEDLADQFQVFYYANKGFCYVSLDSELQVVERDPLETEFNELSERWYRETMMFSFIRQKAMHVCYQNIIGMGKDALPFIFRELSKGKGDWIYALERITRLKESPVPSKATFKVAINAWLQWGKDNGYVSD